MESGGREQVTVRCVKRTGVSVRVFVATSAHGVVTSGGNVQVVVRGE